jgi:hypothetical protein
MEFCGFFGSARGGSHKVGQAWRARIGIESFMIFLGA